MREGLHGPCQVAAGPLPSTNPWIDRKGPRPLLGSRGKAPGRVWGGAPTLPRHMPRAMSRRAVVQIDVQAEGLQFLDQHVEALGNAGLEVILLAHDRLIDLGA